ncbi:MAG TPA: polysaccharide biosynthesis/export family protein [Pyrinomonadaceae bacterium]|nr:polysaccharide biosynthesis/export family protein [Pyrinomonadaceae bacterium]
MTKKFLWLAALAAAALVAPAHAAAQRVGPVEDEPVAAATPNGAAKSEKKPDAAKPAEAGAAKAAEDKAGAKPVAPVSSDKKTSETASKGDANAGGAKPSSPAPTPLPNGGAAHAARGEKAASPAPAESAPPGQSNPPAAINTSAGTPPAPPKYEAPAPVKAEIPASANAAAAVAAAPAQTSIYRLGAGDILDVRMVGSTSREATLYTVLSNGTIDYPLAGEPTRVTGLTPEEIGARLSDALRRRGLFDRAQFQVSVREYVSHTALVSGLVDQPGQKVLRREAVPLYVVLAEAFPRPEAGRVVIISRATGQTKTLDLSDSNALNELVSHGDVINVQPRPREFFYIGGSVASAGQKDFTTGMTLTQAILASGGVARDAGAKVRVAVARQGADGRLVTAEYDLREIEAGRVPDPRIQPGDRIDVGRRR